MRQKKDHAYQLLVEGPDDSAVIRHLLMRHDYKWDEEPLAKPYVDAKVGVEKLLDVLPQELKTPSTKRLGIVLDIDEKLDDRWQAIGQRVAPLGVKLPPQPDPRGTIVPGMFADTQLGIWLMPDNQSAGMLEHFIEKLIPSGDRCWAYAHEAATEAQKRYGGVACPAKELPKSRLYTWLAWQREPGRPFGVALTARFLSHDTPEALAFLDWFHRLFPEPVKAN